MSLPESSHKSYLLIAGLAESTRKKYCKGVCSFVSWCRSIGGKPYSKEDLDRLMCDYIHHIHEAADPTSHAHDALYGLLAVMPEMKPLRRSARALAGLRRLSPSVSYPPLSWELTVAIAVQMIRAGEYRMALGVVVSFDCLLRSGELLALVKEDVAAAGDRRIPSLPSGVAIRLGKTKTGTEQFVTVRNNDVMCLLMEVVKKTQQGQRIFPFTAAKYGSFFRKICDNLGLDRYVPHSLRHGGATKMFLEEGMTVETVMERGRWASSRTARRYIQSGRSLLLGTRVPRGVYMAGVYAAQDLKSSFLTLAQKHSC